MLLGFFIGDFVAVENLIVDIVGAVRETGGVKEEYQELIRELESLDKALKHVDSLRGPAADSIKCAALTCRYPLECFLRGIRKYEKSSGLVAEEKALYLRLSSQKSTEISSSCPQQLTDYLNLHIGSINMQLLTAGLEALDSSGEKAHDRHEEIREGLEHEWTAIAQLGSQVQNQGVLVRATQSTMTTLFGMVSGEIVAPVKELTQRVTTVYASTQQIFLVLLDIRVSMPGIDTRHSFFQAPVKVEDALGRIWPVPSEYSVDDLHEIIQRKFIHQPGQDYVETGRYEVFPRYNTRQLLEPGSGMGLMPGMDVTMAVVVSCFDLRKQCPMPYCTSFKVEVDPGGGNKCLSCHVWFEKSHRKPKVITEVADQRQTGVEILSDSSDNLFDDEVLPVGKRRKTEPGKHELAERQAVMTAFKNLKVPLTPDPKRLRKWNDCSLLYSTEAELLGVQNQFARFHKANGVRIKVLLQKLSVGDLRHIEKLIGLSLEDDIACSAAYQNRTAKSASARRKRVRGSIPQDNLRVWSDSSGSFKTVAKYLGFKKGRVLLHKENGFEIAVRIQKLSVEDQDFVRLKDENNLKEV